MRIRKQVYELTPTDLEQFPVWEFALDEEGEKDQDEATVRPYEFTTPLNPRGPLLVAKAGFTLSDGTHMGGYLTPPAGRDRKINHICPVIVTAEGQVGFWYGLLVPDREILDRNYALLNRSASKVFPLRFKSAIDIIGGTAEGTLEGFMHYAKRTLPLFGLRVKTVK